MNTNATVLIGVLGFGLVLLEFYVKKSSRASSASLAEIITNMNCGILAHSWRVLFYIFLIPGYAFVHRHFSVANIPATPLTVVFAFVIFDFIYYVMHRCSHKSEVLWVGHSIHHQSNVFDFSVAFRQGVFAPILTFPFYLTMAIAGFDVSTFLSVAAINAGIQFLQHTELFGNLGFLERILMTPRHHRVHHSSDLAESNQNFGGVLLIWDQAFGTLARTTNEVKSYGLDKPFHSNNVFLANFKPVIDFVRKVRHTSDRTDYGSNRIQNFAQPWIQYYCLIQFFVLFIACLLFLSKSSQFSPTALLVALLLISLGNFSIGRMLTSRRYAVFVEVLRLIGSPVAIITLM